MNSIQDALNTKLIKRIEHRLQKIASIVDLGITDFYLGGNAINSPHPNDYDLFPVNKDDFKDQLDAVDIGLLPEDLKNKEKQNASKN